MGKIIRTADVDVNPVDDAIVLHAALHNGLLTKPSIVSLGGNIVKITANRGMLCGRDYFMNEEQINVPLPQSGSVINGRIYIEMNLSAGTIEYGAELEPYAELVQEDLNNGGNVYRYVYATYKADNISIKSIKSVAITINQPLIIELGTNWSLNKQTVNVDGINADSYPMYDVKLSGSVETMETDVEEFNKILCVETKENALEFTCIEPTVKPINIIFKF